jgi:2-polyprenyl-3-methyl-5-hydroxy-6-metoxy-1,4-benzoquinol methylase
VTDTRSGSGTDRTVVGSTVAPPRNYDLEAGNHPQHLYAYGFDDLMHSYMMRAWEDDFRDGGVLEMGCFHGHFTQLLCNRFEYVDVVEASQQCIAVASQTVGSRATFFNTRFEDFKPVRRYDNIVMSHTLEHIDEPVAVLRQIGTWLAVGGRLFLATPNARAASRQIAVHMGLIEQTASVTAAEHAHGHRVTYALDTLRADVLRADLRIVRHGGVCFKALANFQIDAALKAGIISRQYLDACFELGRTYPDLCSSIYIVCDCAATAHTAVPQARGPA